MMMADEAPTPTVPANLADLDDDTLAALLDDLVASFDELHDSDDPDLPTLAGLADDIDRCRAAQTERAEQAADAEAERARLADRVHPPEASDTPTDDEPDTPTDDTDTDTDTDTDASATDADREPVLAAGRPPARRNLADVARNAPRHRPPARRTPQVTITAAADLPGLSPGARIDLDQLSIAMHDRARTLQDRGPRAPVARLQVPYEHQLGTDPAENARTIEQVIGNRTAEALVAAGGWCAPSQPIFELFDAGPDLSGLLDLPGLGTRVRGGVMIPSFFGIGDTDGALWTWTEADDIAAADPEQDPPVTKPCLRIPCPTWTECVMEAEGLCVTHGNLSDRAFPELTRDFLRVVFGAHAHRLNAAKIAKIVADAAAVAPAASMLVSDAAADVLGVIELQAADIRSQYRLAQTRTIDAAIPDWLLPALRANLAMRAGVDLLSVSNARLTTWFTDRGIRPQFLSDYQPLSDGGAPATAWPANVTILMWLAGSYVMIDGGNLDLGVVRDSTLNATNDFTAAWSEQFFQVCRRGPQARQVTIPLSIDGVTGCCPPDAPAA